MMLLATNVKRLTILKEKRKEKKERKRKIRRVRTAEPAPRRGKNCVTAR
jgi:hypothetical protein